MKIKLTQTRSHNYNKVEMTIEHDFEFVDNKSFGKEYLRISKLLNTAITEEFKNIDDLNIPEESKASKIEEYNPLKTYSDKDKIYLDGELSYIDKSGKNPVVRSLEQKYKGYDKIIANIYDGRLERRIYGGK